MFGKQEKSLQELLNRLTAHKRMRNPLFQHKIQKVIFDLMGPSIYAYIAKITFKEGTLYLTMNNDSLKNELFYGKEKIVENLNEVLGEEVVKKIYIE
jgi:hypothetical protein